MDETRDAVVGLLDMPGEILVLICQFLDRIKDLHALTVATHVCMDRQMALCAGASYSVHRIVRVGAPLGVVQEVLPQDWSHTFDSLLAWAASGGRLDVVQWVAHGIRHPYMSATDDGNDVASAKRADAVMVVVLPGEAYVDTGSRPAWASASSPLRRAVPITMAGSVDKKTPTAKARGYTARKKNPRSYCNVWSSDESDGSDTDACSAQSASNASDATSHDHDDDDSDSDTDSSDEDSMASSTATDASDDDESPGKSTATTTRGSGAKRDCGCQCCAWHNGRQSGSTKSAVKQPDDLRYEGGYVAHAMLKAAWHGHATVFDWLFDHCLATCGRPSPMLMARVACAAIPKGCLPIVMRVHEFYRSPTRAGVPSSDTDRPHCRDSVAFGKKRIKTGKRVDDDGTEDGDDSDGQTCSCPIEIGVRALLDDQRDIVAWLHEVGCRGAIVPCTFTLDKAVKHGASRVAQWIYETRLPRKTLRVKQSAMTKAVAKGHLQVVAWAHETGLCACTAHHLALALDMKRLDILRWAAGDPPDHLSARRSDWHLPDGVVVNAGRAITAWCSERMLYHAIRRNYAACVEWMLDHGETQHLFTATVLHAALNEGSGAESDVAKLIIASPHTAIDFVAEGENLLMTACAYCDTETVGMLLDRGAPYNARVLAQVLETSDDDTLAYLCGRFGTDDLQTVAYALFGWSRDHAMIKWIQEHAPDVCLAPFYHYAGAKPSGRKPCCHTPPDKDTRANLDGDFYPVAGAPLSEPTDYGFCAPTDYGFCAPPVTAASYRRRSRDEHDEPLDTDGSDYIVDFTDPDDPIADTEVALWRTQCRCPKCSRPDPHLASP